MREDLWAAIIDYRSSKCYVWDPQLNRAREGKPYEGLPILPTLTPNEVGQWRTEFLEQHKSTLHGAALAQALRWKEQSLNAASLPTALQQRWNRALTRRIRRRLQDFFGEQPVANLTNSGGQAQSDELQSFLLDEDAVRVAREKGHPFVAGEILAKAIPNAGDDLLEQLLARLIACWAAPLLPKEGPF